MTGLMSRQLGKLLTLSCSEALSSHHPHVDKKQSVWSAVGIQVHSSSELLRFPSLLLCSVVCEFVLGGLGVQTFPLGTCKC